MDSASVPPDFEKLNPIEAKVSRAGKTQRMILRVFVDRRESAQKLSISPPISVRKGSITHRGRKFRIRAPQKMSDCGYTRLLDRLVDGDQAIDQLIGDFRPDLKIKTYDFRSQASIDAEHYQDELDSLNEALKKQLISQQEYSDAVKKLAMDRNYPVDDRPVVEQTHKGAVLFLPTAGKITGQGRNVTAEERRDIVLFEKLFGDDAEGRETFDENWQVRSIESVRKALAEVENDENKSA
jgi:hypothetical protein